MAAKKKWKPSKVEHVDDLIAEDWWEFRRNGRPFRAHIAVGHAQPDPSGQDWYCPLLLDGIPGDAGGWRAIYGVFALDATSNAFGIVSRLFHEYGPTPLGKPPKASGQRRPRPRNR